MGPGFVVRGHVSRETEWGAFEGTVDDLLGRYGPGRVLNHGIGADAG